MLKNFLLAFLFLITTLFAADRRLESYPNAAQWEQEAIDGDADAMYNLGHTYQTKVKDYEKAIYWYKKAYEKDKGSDAALNIGYVYSDKLKNYNEAIKWYELSAKAGNKDAYYSLGSVSPKRKFLAISTSGTSLKSRSNKPTNSKKPSIFPSTTPEASTKPCPPSQSCGIACLRRSRRVEHRHMPTRRGETVT
jgi:TPR repeat protein